MKTLIESYEIYKSSSNSHETENLYSINNLQTDIDLTSEEADIAAAFARFQNKIQQYYKTTTPHAAQESTNIVMALSGFVNDLFNCFLTQPSTNMPLHSIRSSNPSNESSNPSPSALPFTLSSIRKNMKGNWRIRLDFQNPQMEEIEFEIQLNGQNIDSQQSMDDDSKVCTITFATEENLEEKYLEIFLKTDNTPSFVFNFTDLKSE